MMMKKIYTAIFSSLFAIFLFCIFIGRLTARSYIDNTDLNKYLSIEDRRVCLYEMGYDEDTNIGFLDGEKIDDITDMMDKAVIVKAHLKEGYLRSIYYECVLSCIEIDAVLQGDIIPGESVMYFEPVDCRNIEMDCTDGYALMQPDKEYILFLKKLKNAGYGKDEYVYAPINNTYGKFCDEPILPPIFKESQLESPQNAVKYSEVKEVEILLYDFQMHQKYCKLKSQARRLFETPE